MTKHNDLNTPWIENRVLQHEEAVERIQTQVSNKISPAMRILLNMITLLAFALDKLTRNVDQVHRDVVRQK